VGVFAVGQVQGIARQLRVKLRLRERTIDIVDLKLHIDRRRRRLWLLGAHVCDHKD
jgi:hypothetical protein